MNNPQYAGMFKENFMKICTAAEGNKAAAGQEQAVHRGRNRIAADLQLVGPMTGWSFKSRPNQRSWIS